MTCIFILKLNKLMSPGKRGGLKLALALTLHETGPSVMNTSIPTWASAIEAAKKAQTTNTSIIFKAIFLKANKTLFLMRKYSLYKSLFIARPKPS